MKFNQFSKVHLTRCIILFLSCTGFIFCVGCSSDHIDQTTLSATSDADSVLVTDSNGITASLNSSSRVVSLYGSYAECWLLAGGNLVGVTQDAIDERNLSLSGEVSIVGNVKDPNLEKIVSLNPDYVILSADLTAHQQLCESLRQLHIPYGSFTVDTFDDYAVMMQQFCNVTQRQDLYETNVSSVRTKIDSIKTKVSALQSDPQSTHSPSVLLMRAYTSGIKAKGADNLAGIILKEFGCINLVDNHPSMLEDISIEQILVEDPQYIFVLTMGDESKALKYLSDNITANPAWSQLSAITANQYVVLPKDLFHYKPNQHWAESYEYIAKILFPDQF